MNEQLRERLLERWRVAQDGGSEASRTLMAIDDGIAEEHGRTVAPFILDMSGFTTMVLQHGVPHYLSMIARMQELCVPIVLGHGGSLVKREADNLFAHFPDVASAFAAAQSCHEAAEGEGSGSQEAFQMRVSVGIGFGPLLVFEDDMWGTELILASKLGEDTAKAGETLITDAAREDIEAAGALPDLEERILTFGAAAHRAWSAVR